MTTKDPFSVYKLDGISLFDDLMSKISEATSISLIRLHVVSLSFHQEFISDLNNNVEIYLKDKPIENYLIIKEEDIQRYERNRFANRNIEQTTIILNQVTAPESLGFIVHCIESGNSVYVFRKWDFHGTERRSAFSILQRDSMKMLDYLSRQEIEPWLAQIRKRASDLRATQTLEFI